MRSLNLLTRLAGAHPDVLAKAKTDRAKFATMGVVLLTTAGFAGVSATFALTTSVGLPLPAAIVAGVLWGCAILALDRMLVVSLTRQSGWVRNAIAAVPRLLLAFVIGSVVSVPLVLRIFQPEINSELEIMHSENLTVAQEKLDKRFADIPRTQERVTELQAIASGQSQPSVSADPDVVAAQEKVTQAQQAYDTAAANAQCELLGTCGSFQPGVGEAYRQAKARADEAAQTLSEAKAHLAQVTSAAQARISGGTASNTRAAAEELKTLVPRLEKRKAERAEAQRRLDNGELNNEGMLARLEALDRLSAEHGNMQLAQLALTALFLLIELLPVVVKLLSVFGAETLYERLLAAEEDTIEKRSTSDNTAALRGEKDLADKQFRARQKANKQLVAKQSAIAKKAIDTWGEIAKSRSDDELARWYAKHSGQSVPTQPTQPPRKPAPASVTVPLMTPVPPPAAGGAQTYRQFRAAAGVPPTYQQFKAAAGPPPNGHHPPGPSPYPRNNR